MEIPNFWLGRSAFRVLGVLAFAVSFANAAEKFPKTTNAFQENLRYERDLLAIQKAEQKFKTVTVPWMEKCVNALTLEIEALKEHILQARHEAAHPGETHPVLIPPETVHKAALGKIAYFEKRIDQDEAMLKEFEDGYRQWPLYFKGAKESADREHRKRIQLLDEAKQRFVERAKARLEKEKAVKAGWQQRIQTIQADGQKALAGLTPGSAAYKSRVRTLEINLREPHYRLGESEKDIALIGMLISNPPEQSIRGYPLIERILQDPPEPSESLLAWGSKKAAEKIVEDTLWEAIKRFASYVGKKLLIAVAF